MIPMCPHQSHTHPVLPTFQFLQRQAEELLASFLIETKPLKDSFAHNLSDWMNMKCSVVWELHGNYFIRAQIQFAVIPFIIGFAVIFISYKEKSLSTLSIFPDSKCMLKNNDLWWATNTQMPFMSYLDIMCNVTPNCVFYIPKIKTLSRHFFLLHDKIHYYKFVEITIAYFWFSTFGVRFPSVHCGYH